MSKTLTKNDLNELRVAVAERDASQAIVACIEGAILSESPKWQHLLSERAKLVERQARFDLVMRDLKLSYDLSDGDQVDPGTGVVTPLQPADQGADPGRSLRNPSQS